MAWRIGIAQLDGKPEVVCEAPLKADALRQLKRVIYLYVGAGSVARRAKLPPDDLG